MDKPILFIDFHGTISFYSFWHSFDIQTFSRINKCLFSENRHLVREWMVGKHSSEDIVEQVSRSLGMDYNFLWHRFVSDCKNIAVCQKSLEYIQAVSPYFTTVLITENMDTFHRFVEPELYLSRTFDEILCSYDERQSKNDTSGILFKQALKKWRSSIHESILIDDSKQVCAIFSELGGKALRVTNEFPATNHLQNLYENKIS